MAHGVDQKVVHGVDVVLEDVHQIKVDILHLIHHQNMDVHLANVIDSYFPISCSFKLISLK